MKSTFCNETGRTNPGSGVPGWDCSIFFNQTSYKSAANAVSGDASSLLQQGLALWARRSQFFADSEWEGGATTAQVHPPAKCFPTPCCVALCESRSSKCPSIHALNQICPGTAVFLQKSQTTCQLRSGFSPTSIPNSRGDFCDFCQQRGGSQTAINFSFPGNLADSISTLWIEIRIAIRELLN